jgi:hypothetical protein
MRRVPVETFSLVNDASGIFSAGGCVLLIDEILYPDDSVLRISLVDSSSEDF